MPCCGMRQPLTKVYLPSSQLSPQARSTLMGTSQRQGGAHFVADELGFGFDGGSRDVEDQFVVDLDEHASTGRCSVTDAAMDVDHRPLDQVGGRALDHRVDRHALGPASAGPCSAS